MTRRLGTQPISRIIRYAKNFLGLNAVYPTAYKGDLENPAFATLLDQAIFRETPGKWLEVNALVRCAPAAHD
jgi:hypothetical protein